MSKKNSSQKIKVALFSYLTRSGAGFAVLQLHQAFKLHPQVEPTLFLPEIPDKSSDSSIKIFRRTPDEMKQIASFQHYTNNNIYEGNTTFSYPNIGKNFAQLDEIINEFDIINLHWINHLLSLEEVAYLTHHHTPIFLTVHDKNLFGGGATTFMVVNNGRYRVMTALKLIIIKKLQNMFLMQKRSTLILIICI